MDWGTRDLKKIKALGSRVAGARVVLDTRCAGLQKRVRQSGVLANGWIVRWDGISEFLSTS